MHSSWIASKSARFLYSSLLLFVASVCRRNSGFLCFGLLKTRAECSAVPVPRTNETPRSPALLKLLSSAVRLLRLLSYLAQLHDGSANWAIRIVVIVQGQVYELGTTRVPVVVITGRVETGGSIIIDFKCARTLSISKKYRLANSLRVRWQAGSKHKGPKSPRMPFELFLCA